MNPWRLLLLVALALSSLAGSADDRTFYDIRASIAPGTGSLEVTLVLDYVHGGEETGSVEFLLHRDLEITSLAGPGIEGFASHESAGSDYPFTPEAKLVSLRLVHPLSAGQNLRVEMAYSGSIGIVGEWETNRITGEWVELGMYAPWFPYFPAATRIGFDIDLSIDETYAVAANGHTTRTGDGRWRIRNRASDNDIVLAASRDMRSMETGGHGRSFTLHWTVDLEDGTLSGFSGLGSGILQRYSEWFGDSGSARGSVLITPRQKGGGYARRGLVVLSAIDDDRYHENKMRYTRYLAHELAHLWWNRARPDTWHDWLNESFAEYSALMFIRESEGSQEFERRMATKRERALGLPPVRGLDRDDARARGVLYDKGPAHLQALERRMGQAAFRRLLRDACEAGVSTTGQFLSLLEKTGGRETMEYFSALLDN